jgi:hypothetical protein
MSEHLTDTQRHLEQSALRNVRNLVDKLESEDRERDRVDRRWTTAAFAVVAIAAVAIVGTLAYRPKSTSIAVPAAATVSNAIVAPPATTSCTWGAFEIVYMGRRKGQFKVGRKSDAGVVTCEMIDVDAGSNSDLKRAMVKRMIEMIRADRRGNIKWQSSRLERTVDLSLDPKNDDHLEDFLIAEFFGTSNDSSRGTAPKGRP